MSETRKKTEEAVKTTGLTKSYQGRTVLKGLNLSVKVGTVFGLVSAPLLAITVKALPPAHEVLLLTL